MVANEQAQYQHLSVEASNDANDAHEGQPAQPTDDGPSTLVHGTDPPPTFVTASPSAQPTSVEDFIAGLKLPLEKSLIQSPLRFRVSCVQVENVVPRRSDRLAAKSIYRDPNTEKQAKRIMLSKWQPSASAPRSTPVTPDATIATRFHETFQEPLSSSKRAAMRELFPHGWCSREASGDAGILSKGSLNVASSSVAHLVLQQRAFHRLAVPCVRIQPHRSWHLAVT
jgi:hypothetical protein